MATSIRLDDDFVSDVKFHADAASRSIPEQIEHWAKIGRIAEDNPDLPKTEAVRAIARYQSFHPWVLRQKT